MYYPDYEVWEDLANGIIAENIRQLQNCLHGIDTYKRKRDIERCINTVSEIRIFFYSDWFKTVSREMIDGPRAFERMIDNYHKYGNVKGRRYKNAKNDLHNPRP